MLTAELGSVVLLLSGAGFNPRSMRRDHTDPDGFANHFGHDGGIVFHHVGWRAVLDLVTDYTEAESLSVGRDTDELLRSNRVEKVTFYQSDGHSWHPTAAGFDFEGVQAVLVGLGESEIIADMSERL